MEPINNDNITRELFSMKFDSPYEKETYECIGKFIFNFEAMQESIRYFLKKMIHLHGLRDLTLFEILVSDATAYPLLNYFKATVNHLLEEQLKKGNSLDHFNKICSEIERAMGKRNNIAHAFWFIFGWFDKGTEIQSTVNAKKYIIDKKGKLKDYWSGIDHSQLEEINKHAQDILNLQANI